MRQNNVNKELQFFFVKKFLWLEIFINVECYAENKLHAETSTSFCSALLLCNHFFYSFWLRIILNVQQKISLNKITALLLIFVQCDGFIKF